MKLMGISLCVRWSHLLFSFGICERGKLLRSCQQIRIFLFFFVLDPIASAIISSTSKDSSGKNTSSVSFHVVFLAVERYLVLNSLHRFYHVQMSRNELAIL